MSVAVNMWNYIKKGIDMKFQAKIGISEPNILMLSLNTKTKLYVFFNWLDINLNTACTKEEYKIKTLVNTTPNITITTN